MRSFILAPAMLFAILNSSGCDSGPGPTEIEGVGDAMGDWSVHEGAASARSGIEHATHLDDAPEHAFNDFVQSPGGPSSDFVFATARGAIFEMDPRHLGEYVFRTDDAPRNIVALAQDHYDDSILALTRNGDLYQSDGQADWTIWVLVGTVPLQPGGRCADIQQSAGETGDFVISDDIGGIYEVDPRHLSSIVLRTTEDPIGIVSLFLNGYATTMFALTSDGDLYESSGEQDWTVWSLVASIPLQLGAVAVDGVQSAGWPTADFVFVDDMGGVYEMDPRHVGDVAVRTFDGPLRVVALCADTWDDTLLTLTPDGRLYQSDGSNQWADWDMVGSLI
ncbi:MAG: hypothetical protein CME06_18130 [Gemmatimonadetes bacterium]|nr:hypothetical protein [Gemmatimonadota bacterium]